VNRERIARTRPTSRANAFQTAFLVNPASASGATGRRWARLERRAARLGLTGKTYRSERPGHLSDLARKAVADGATLLVAVGGDGTVHEVVNGLAEDPAAELAVIPYGTGTDFARSMGIPTAFEKAVTVAISGSTRPIDLGRAVYRTSRDGQGASYFANIGSAGMSGAIARQTNEGSKLLGGKLSYLWSTVAVFARWRPAELRVSVDGEDRKARMHDVVVANGPYFGGGIMICPDAVPDDGLFDVLLLGDLAKRDLALNMHKTYRGKHLPHPKAELLRGTTVSVEALEPVPIELDGEQPGTTPARFEIVPRRLRLRVP
jgi:diacylglycerol kinase (ATP)